MGIVIALIIGTAIGITYNKKIEETYALAAIFLILVNYVLGLFFPLGYGFWGSICFGMIAVVYCIFNLITNRKAIRNTILTWGGLALFSFFCFFVYYSYHRDFNHPDEFYCWGLMAKGYYYNGELFSRANTAISGEQPPFIPLWNFYNSKLWVNFSDSICYLSQNFFTVSMLVPFFAHVKSRMTTPKFIAMAGFIPLMLVLSGMEGFEYILVDGVLAAEMCFFLINAITYVEKRDYYYHFASAITLISIVLTKRIGIVFAALALICIAPIMIKGKRFKELFSYTLCVGITAFSWFGIGIKDYKIAFLLFLSPFIAVICAMILLFILKKIFVLDAKYRNCILMILFLGISAFFVLGGNMIANDGYSYAVLARFCRDFIYLTVDKGFIKLSYGIFVVMALGLTTFLTTRRKDTLIRDVVAFLTISMLIYAILMLYLHINSVGPLNGYIEGIVPRYLIPWESIVVFLYFYEYVVLDEESTFEKCLVVFMIVALISNTGDFFKGLFNKHQTQNYYAFRDAGVELQTGDMIYFVDEKYYYGYSDREFYYYMFPARTNFIDKLFLGTLDELTIPKEEFKEELLEGYDYLYLQTCTEGFIERYADFFGGPDKVIQGSAYYVIKDSDDDVILKKLERQE